MNRINLNSLTEDQNILINKVAKKYAKDINYFNYEYSI